MFPKQCASLYIITCFCIKRIHYNPLWPVDRVFVLVFISLPSNILHENQENKKMRKKIEREMNSIERFVTAFIFENCIIVQLYWRHIYARSYEQ